MAPIAEAGQSPKLVVFGVQLVAPSSVADVTITVFKMIVSYSKIHLILSRFDSCDVKM